MGCLGADKDRWAQSGEGMGRGVYEASIPLTTICLGERGVVINGLERVSAGPSSSPRSPFSGEPSTSPPGASASPSPSLSWRLVMIQAGTWTLLCLPPHPRMGDSRDKNRHFSVSLERNQKDTLILQ